MKNCQFCGAEIQDHQVICPACFRYTIPELDPKNMRVYAADGREFGPHLSKEQQGIRNPAFEKAFQRSNVQPQHQFCTQCGTKLPAGARFCRMCGAACQPLGQQSVQIPEVGLKKRVKQTGRNKTLFAVIAVLAAVVLILAGVLTGILVSRNNNAKIDWDDREEDSVRDENGEDDGGEEAAGGILGGTETYKLVQSTGTFQTDTLDNSVRYTYNEAGKLIGYEKTNHVTLYGQEQELSIRYSYDEEGKLVTAEMQMDDVESTFGYVYENGVPVSCGATVDGIYGEFLYTTDQNGNITSVAMVSEEISIPDFITAVYDVHGCMTEIVYKPNDSNDCVIHRFNCDGKQIAVENHFDWFFSSTENDYDEEGRLISSRQFMNGEQVNDIQYVYSYGRTPVLEALVISSEDMSVELPFEWDGNTGVSTPDPELSGGEVGTVIATVDDEGDLLSLCIESEGTRMETYTTYVTLELPKGQEPSNPNDILYLHTIFAALMA